jgi:GntR family transcriptional regulator/MocR family aminotransferase
MKRAALVGIPPLTLDRRRPLPAQIAAGIRAAIQTGRVRVGDRLPASRPLAREIGVARQVVVAAYEDLAATGHLASRTGAGSYVAIDARPQIAPPIRQLRDPDGQPILIFPLT